MKPVIRMAIVSAAMLVAGGCVKHEVEVKPVEVDVKPIHITVDVNVKVDHELDQFFDFQKDTTAPKETQP